MNPFAGFALRTLGDVALEYRAQPCELAYEKGRALLVFLAVESGRAYARSTLAAMFWPALEREAALTNLRQVLFNLRRTFAQAGAGGSPLLVERETVRLHAEFARQVDAVALANFNHACPEPHFEAHCKLCLEQMEGVIGSYAGEFLRGFSLPDCPDFEEWVQIQREGLHLRILAILARLAECNARTGAYAKALRPALRYLELEPWSEENLRRVMRLYSLNGQIDAALTCYRASALALKRELGVLPSAETVALAEKIERGELVIEAGRDAKNAAASNGTGPTTVGASERRQVTVLFCEMSAPAAEDPDELMALMAAPQSQCLAIIREHQGYVAQTHGGGLLAYFGFPRAAENAAQQAVQTALQLVGQAYAGLELRVGVHSGMVISGDAQLPDAIGAASGLAIRLRQVVDGGEVAISGATQRLVEGFFECDFLGSRQLRGIAKSVDVFRVTRESGARGRLEARAAWTPLVGRQLELEKLRSLWQATRSGNGRVVVLTGEPGVGKSRLIKAFKQSLAQSPCAVREMRCAPEYSRSPLYPLAELLESASGCLPGDSAAEKFDKLAAYVEAQYAGAADATVPLYARILGLDLRSPYREPVLTLPQRRETLLGILLDRQKALAGGGPCLLVVEDLQWADPSTLELLDLYVAQAHRMPVLTILTSRHGFPVPWGADRVVSIPLPALDVLETSDLVVGVVPDLPPPVVQRIVERADGIPLFAEELAREAVRAEQRTIPPTLLDLLWSRLDNLGPAKVVAQSAATVGREFPFALLPHITPFDEDLLRRLVDQLLEAGVLFAEAREAYRFRHALIRDAAYESQTRSERETMHRRIAAALGLLGGNARPELFAQHWAAGGEIVKAISCWIEAGQLASRDAANQEAMTHFRAGLALAESLPAGDERERLELELFVGLGAAATAVHGYASAEGIEFYERAMMLCGVRTEDSSLFPPIWRLWTSASSRVGYGCAYDLAQHLLHMAESGSDPVQVQQARFALGNTLYWQGKFDLARTHLEQVRATYRPASHAKHIAGFGEDVGVTAESYYSWVMWFLGFPDQAETASIRAVALARQLGHPFSLAYALTFAALLHCRLGRAQEAQRLAAETLKLARKHGFSLWEIGANLAHGWAQTLQGHAAGVAQIETCVKETRLAMGGVTLVVLAPLADALVRIGRFNEAVRSCDEALAVSTHLGDHHAEAELHRLKGESLWRSDVPDLASAEVCLQRALTIGHNQRAMSLKLRAAMSLAQLWQSQGRLHDAKTILEAVYHEFTEGFDTPDLRAARKLLNRLAA